MDCHPAKTRAILDKFRFPENLKSVPEVAGHHHEKVNGHGYPGALKDKELPLGSKILAVADVFDALTSPRDYPKYDGKESFSLNPMPLTKVVNILKKERNRHFDPNVVDAFLQVLPRALEFYGGTHFPKSYIDTYYGMSSIMKN